MWTELLPLQEEELRATVEGIERSKELKKCFERTVLSIMVQYVADSAPDQRAFVNFADWLKTLDSQLAKQAFALFTEEELRVLWEKKDEQEAYKIAENDIAKEMERSLNFLVTILITNRKI